MPKKPTKATGSSEIPVNCAHTRMEAIERLIPHPRNPNRHPDEQVARLAKIIRFSGWRAPIVVSKRSGYIVAGHGRLAAAQLLQVAKAPVDYQDFESDEQELAHLVADNQIPELAEMDDNGLAGILAELKDVDIDLDVTGMLDDEIAKLLKTDDEEEGEGKESSPKAPDVLEEFSVHAHCKDQPEQVKLFKRLMSQGFKCELVSK
jgi:ParB-like chromosome segregation protein Spo0J